jgi:hypothetical protein
MAKPRDIRPSGFHIQLNATIATTCTNRYILNFNAFATLTKNSATGTVKIIAIQIATETQSQIIESTTTHRPMQINFPTKNHCTFQKKIFDLFWLSYSL